MADISAQAVKELRERTGAAMMDCKKALVETSGDQEKAIEYLRKKGLKSADKKSGRATSEGGIGFYMHHDGRKAAMVQVACETDFVARNEEFQGFLKSLCMHILMKDPVAVRRDEIDPTLIEKERAIFMEQAKDKPEDKREKIVEGQVDKFVAERCLLEQKFIMDEKKSIEDLLKEQIAKLGENMEIKRFARMVVGED
ncbi:MAG: translation elongation factor Ts [Planctomycetota bacterium]